MSRCKKVRNIVSTVNGILCVICAVLCIVCLHLQGGPTEGPPREGSNLSCVGDRDRLTLQVYAQPPTFSCLNVLQLCELHVGWMLVGENRCVVYSSYLLLLLFCLYKQTVNT